MEKLKMEQVSFMTTKFKKSNFSTYKFIVICTLTLSAIFYSCVDNPVPDPLYPVETLPSLSDRPTITSISPAVEAGAGVREIQIRGSKLGIKNGTDTNWLLIAGLKPIYKQITDSLITIYRPNLSDDKYGNTIYFNITDPTFEGASSSKEYVIQKPGATVGDYTGDAAMLAFDFDQNENLYVLTGGRNLLRTDSAGVTKTTILLANNFPSGTGDLASTTDIAFGPGDSLKNLYMINGKNFIYRQKWTVDVPSNANKGTKITLTPEIIKMDIDEIGNIYAGGRTGIYRIDSSIGTNNAPSVTGSLGYAGLNIKQIRVTKINSTNYIYVADSLNVWRSVLNNGSFTDKEQLVVTLNGTAYASNFINSIAIDDNGGIFLCLKNYPKYSLFVLDADGSITPFYADPTILPNTVEQLEWGNHNQLYLLSGSLTTAGRVYRLNLVRDGAVYNGRKFVK
jgi:hypothetical protein